jgi:hypothetical protein
MKDVDIRVTLKSILKEIVCEVVDVMQNPVVGFCEHGKEPSIFIKRTGFSSSRATASFTTGFSIPFIQLLPPPRFQNDFICP